jgi:two-component system, sensor histidine kinase RegB
LMSELKGQPELLEDAKLIRDQADRCRDILRNMGRAGKDDLHLRQAPLGAVLKEAAEPHIARGKAVLFGLSPGPGGSDRQPTVLRSPEIIHGLRNLVQNAVDFAHGQVWVDAEWTAQNITVRIADDGEGYAPQVLGRIGDPFVRSRRADDEGEERPAYEGMGLGLFIAKTLLERSGAVLMFANGSDPFLDSETRPARSGAVVEVVWPTKRLIAPTDIAKGENRKFEM